ncbi:uncharacterized protein [Nicotiana tomentosiformis]|uniref:uncharacterized protein n=1 Tax=Nicotiana tomentosiformis TaxID=4098 RepID=UPI00388C69CD
MVVEVQHPWKMYFDGVVHRGGAGVGVVFVTSQGEVLPYSFTLTQLCSNNVVEYQALILGLEIAVDMNQLQLQVFGDSQLVVNQLLGSYEVKKPELRPYNDYTKNLIGWLDDVTIQHMPRKANKKADALAALASSLTLPDQAQVTLRKKNGDNPLSTTYVMGYFQKIRGEGPKSVVVHLASFTTKILYTEGHSREYFCDTYGKKKHSKICKRHILGCKACQFHVNFIHQPPEVLHPTVASWLFDAWGLDIVGPLPKSSVVALKEVKKENVASFIQVSIIYRFGIPRYIITDNGKPSDNRLMKKICELFGFNQRNSSMYNAAANGLAEAFNKTLCNLLKKVISKSKRDWHDRMEEALWAYRTTHCTLTQTTPYALVYGVEAVLPLERQIPLL